MPGLARASNHIPGAVGSLNNITICIFPTNMAILLCVLQTICWYKISPVTQLGPSRVMTYRLAELRSSSPAKQTLIISLGHLVALTMNWDNVCAISWNVIPTIAGCVTTSGRWNDEILESTWWPAGSWGRWPSLVWNVVYFLFLKAKWVKLIYVHFL